MVRKIKSLLANLALLGVTLALVFAVFEFGVFKYILPADDVLPSVTINKVVRYEPNTRAVFRRPDGSTDLVTINADGWNSTKLDYVEAKEPGTLRIAVIGDSYVHGAFVDVDKGFPEVMERQLQAKGLKVEVYRFGADGAPLSQYLNVLREEVLRFSPDIVLVQLIHNDFDESYRFLGTRYESSFMKVGENAQGDVVEIPAKPFKPGLADKLRQFRSFRYLYYQTGLYQKIGYYVNRYWWGGEQLPDVEEFTSSAVDVRTIRDHDKIRKFSHYIFKQMQKLSAEHGFRLAFAMDGVREAVYAGKDRSDYEVSALNDIVVSQMREFGFPYVDLQEAFAADYAKRGERFEFSYDWHWNERGNDVVADALVSLLMSNPKLLGQKSLAANEIQ